MRFSRILVGCGAPAALLWLQTAALAVYAQNFDGLALGSINGQDGWAGDVIDVVQNTSAKSLFALRARSSITCFRDGVFDSYAAAPSQRVRFDYMLTNVGGTTTSNIEFIGPADTPTGDRYVRLNYVGGVNAFLIEGASATIFGPGTVQANVWYDVAVDIDFTARTADFLIRNPDGTTYFDPAPMSMLEPVAANRLAFNAALGPALHIDNLVVSNVPEPAGSLAALAVASGLVLRRRSATFSR